MTIKSWWQGYREKEITILKGDGRKVNLPNSSFDVVYSNATIEHVGSSINQIDFIKECIRLSRDKIFISMPNRYFPIDFHSKIPLIHMFPKEQKLKMVQL